MYISSRISLSLSLSLSVSHILSLPLSLVISLHLSLSLLHDLVFSVSHIHSLSVSHFLSLSPSLSLSFIYVCVPLCEYISLPFSFIFPLDLYILFSVFISLFPFDRLYYYILTFSFSLTLLTHTYTVPLSLSLLSHITVSSFFLIYLSSLSYNNIIINVFQSRVSNAVQ